MTSRSTESLYRVALPSRPSGKSSGPTDGRTDGLTKSLTHQPDTSFSFVTRAPAYGIYGRLIPDNGRTAKEAKRILRQIGRDPHAKDHVRVLQRWAASEYRARRRTRHALLLDDVVVDRLITGEAVESTRAERIEATRLLTNKGRSIEDIAKALRTTTKSVQRYRSELNQPTGEAA